MTLLAIDPGRSFKEDRTIGWAMPLLEFRGKMNWKELCAWLQVDTEEHALEFFQPFHGWFPIDEIVCEDFVNDPKSARGGQRNGTSECIGAVEILATQAGVPFHRQRSEALGPAKLHAPKGSWADLKHLRHEDAAYLHGYEFLVREGRLQPAGLADTL